MSALLSDWEMWAGSCFPSLQPTLNGAIKSKNKQAKASKLIKLISGNAGVEKEFQYQVFHFQMKCKVKKKKKKLTKISATI